MNSVIYGQRIKAARLLKGWSLQDLSDHLKTQGVPLSRQALFKYETGLVIPDREKVKILSAALSVNPEYFAKNISVTLENPEFRKLIKFPAKDVDRIVQLTKDHLERYLELETIVCATANFENPLQGFKTISELEDIEEATLLLRDKWNLGDKPIYNLVEQLEDFHIKIIPVEADEDFDGMQAWVNDKIPVIAYNKKKVTKPDRIRFTILHELGHLLLDVNHYSFRKKEQLCHQFAAAMLLPKVAVVSETGPTRQRLMIEELGHLKQQYGISIQAALYRLRDLEVINEHYFKQFYFYINQMNWRVDEPFEYNGLEKSSRFDQLLFRAFAEGVIDEKKAAELKNIPLQDFRRERLSVYSTN